MTDNKAELREQLDELTNYRYDKSKLDDIIGLFEQHTNQARVDELIFSIDERISLSDPNIFVKRIEARIDKLETYKGEK